MNDLIKPYYEKNETVIYHGDCNSILPLLMSCSIDAILTDPPYGVTSQEWDVLPELNRLWGSIDSVLRPHGVAIFTASQTFTSKLVSSKIEWFKHEWIWIWIKTRAANFGGAKYQPMKKHESVVVFAPGLYTYNPIKTIGVAYKSRIQHPRTNTKYGTFGTEDYQPNKIRDERYPSSIIEIPSLRQQDLVHPTQKPLELMKYLIQTYTNERNVVLDPYMGSGTTLIAAKKLKRKSIGIEKEERYCEIAVQRLEST